jgi:hypothetical protein
MSSTEPDNVRRLTLKDGLREAVAKRRLGHTAESVDAACARVRVNANVLCEVVHRAVHGQLCKHHA